MYVYMYVCMYVQHRMTIPGDWGFGAWY